ncbi:MAG: 4-alpha-glucanotransferase [Bryobacterales bacterium]|nr:4-alpha-glucanotransferase [Bryobacterales bacterium]
MPGPNGVGQIGPEAFRFADWLAGAGQRIWQVLPLRPTG